MKSYNFDIPTATIRAQVRAFIKRAAVAADTVDTLARQAAYVAVCHGNDTAINELLNAIDPSSRTVLIALLTGTKLFTKSGKTTANGLQLYVKHAGKPAASDAARADAAKRLTHMADYRQVIADTAAAKKAAAKARAEQRAAEKAEQQETAANKQREEEKAAKDEKTGMYDVQGRFAALIDEIQAAQSEGRIGLADRAAVASILAAYSAMRNSSNGPSQKAKKATKAVQPAAPAEKIAVAA